MTAWILIPGYFMLYCGASLLHVLQRENEGAIICDLLKDTDTGIRPADAWEVEGSPPPGAKS